MPQVTVVDGIDVHVVAGETSFPGENGFAAIWAEIRTSNPAVKARLEQAASNGQSVTLRCAMIDVIGKVRRQDVSGADCVFVVGVDDLVYRAPGNAAIGT